MVIQQDSEKRLYIKRGLPNIKKSIYAFSVLSESKTKQALEGILSEKELHAREEISIEKYAKQVNIEANLMVELFRTYIFPAALRYQNTLFGAAVELPSFSQNLQKAILATDQLEKIRSEAVALPWEARAKIFCDQVLPKMEEVRLAVDALEQLIPHDLWPLPKYREILFIR